MATQAILELEFLNAGGSDQNPFTAPYVPELGGAMVSVDMNGGGPAQTHRVQASNGGYLKAPVGLDGWYVNTAFPSNHTGWDITATIDKQGDFPMLRVWGDMTTAGAGGYAVLIHSYADELRVYESTTSFQTLGTAVDTEAFTLGSGSVTVTLQKRVVAEVATIKVFIDGAERTAVTFTDATPPTGSRFAGAAFEGSSTRLLRFAATAEVPDGPTLSSPTVVSTGNAIATVRVTTDTAPSGSSTLAVQVLPAADPTPTAAAILASPTQTITSGASGARDFNLTSLTNGTAYRAHFAQTGPSNVVSTVSFTPSTVPGAPTIGTAVAGNAQATVNGTAPGSTGGSAITGYRSTATPGGSTVTGASLPITHTGLTNGTAYTFTLAAENANGYGTESAASNSVTPSAGSPPPPPPPPPGITLSVVKTDATGSADYVSAPTRLIIEPLGNIENWGTGTRAISVTTTAVNGEVTLPALASGRYSVLQIFPATGATVTGVAMDIVTVP